MKLRCLMAAHGTGYKIIIPVTENTDSDLVEVAFVHGLRDVADLAPLVGFPLLLIQLLCQCLQFGQGHLERQAVCVAHRCVLQHVLDKEETMTGHYLVRKHHKGEENNNTKNDENRE